MRHCRDAATLLRLGRSGGLLAGALAALLGATLLVGSPAYAQAQPYAQQPYAQQPYAQDADGFVDTPYGPLGPADRDLLVFVRYAGLWEIPAGEMAAERGSTEQIREIGTFIAEEHRELDEATLEVAAELRVALPTEMMAEHQSWVNQIDAAEGEEFDRRFIQLLREAHGSIYPLIAYVRSGTQNDLVRDFADVGELFVSRHMTYLESSGLVDWFAIPPPPEPAGTQTRFLASSPAGVNPLFIWILLGIAAAAGGVTVVRTVRPR